MEEEERRIPCMYMYMYIHSEQADRPYEMEDCYVTVGLVCMPSVYMRWRNRIDDS